MICNVYRAHKIGCSCSDKNSYPNKFMFNLLEQLKFKFEKEYNPDWIKPKRYDFYFEIDNLALEHDIEVIRIISEKSELESIKNNILNSTLNNILNLTNIDWLKCEEFALSNLCKKACEYKKNNPNMTTTQIGELMSLNSATIGNYLKKGSTLGWCDYNPIEERKSHCIKIEIFKDNISLGIFKSIREISCNSEKLFNVKLLNEFISISLREQKQYKGYTFGYIK